MSRTVPTDHSRAPNRLDPRSQQHHWVELQVTQCRIQMIYWQFETSKFQVLPRARPRESFTRLLRSGSNWIETWSHLHSGWGTVADAGRDRRHERRPPSHGALSHTTQSKNVQLRVKRKAVLHAGCQRKAAQSRCQLRVSSSLACFSTSSSFKFSLP